MSDRDPIATSTLAALYIGQGHLRRANEVLREVLARDRFDGHALCLEQRLRIRAAAALTCRIGAQGIEVAWNAVDVCADLLAVAVVFRPWDGGVRTLVRSTACTRSRQSWTVPLPCATGAVTACLGRVEPHHGFVAYLVSQPSTWDRGGAVGPAADAPATG